MDNFNLLDKTFSLIHPKSPPLMDVSEILKSIATFSKPSVLILFFISLILAFNSTFGTALIIISEIKYS